MSKKLRRKFHIDDADFLHEALVIGALFKEDKGDFINFDSDFSDPFYDDLVLLIEECYSNTDNKTLIYQQMQLAGIVEENMQSCSEKFKDAKHFIEKAFPKNRTMREVFGYKRYGKVRKNKTGMVGFMRTFHALAEKYSAELIANNYTQVMIDEIETVADELENSICDHELFIKTRSTAARNRIVKMNELYDLIMQVCKAGKRIYKNDWAMYQRYLFKHFKKTKKLKAAA